MQHTIMCADQPTTTLQPPSPMSDFKDHSPAFSSGSSAQNSSHITEEDIEERDKEPPLPIIFSPVEQIVEYRPLLKAPPIYSLESVLGYGSERVLFIEKLLWNCVGKIYGIYGEPIIRTSGPTTSMPLHQLVHDGIVHGLCNEIVIMPIMSATQKLSGIQQSHQSADVIPFPLFMAEMLRRMRSSYFLLQTAMRYILDMESQIRSARERSSCGWCRSGAYGCDHSTPPETTSASRFSKGRSNILRKPSAISSSLKSADFSSHDVLHPLADPRKAFLGALILANKFHRDRSIGNKAWAAMIGLQLNEVHNAERAVGQALGWTLSRPWVRDVRDENGVWAAGSTHPSLAEPLFASTEAEAAKYGVKALRIIGAVPAALDSNALAKELPTGDLQLESICMTPPPYQPMPMPDALSRRSRSQTLLANEERRVAPLPHRPAQAFLQAHAKSSSPIKKANSAPDVMQPSYQSQQGSTLTAEIDMAVQSEWTTYASAKASLDTFMDTTPTLEPTRSKRKASNDFGPNGARRRGILGQRVHVQSPDEMTPVASLSKNTWVDPQLQMQQWDMCGDDDSSCPELSPGTPTTTSPSIGLLTRTSTPSNLLELVTGTARKDHVHMHKDRPSQCYVPFGLSECPHSYEIIDGLPASH